MAFTRCCAFRFMVLGDGDLDFVVCRSGGSGRTDSFVPATLAAIVGLGMGLSTIGEEDAAGGCTGDESTKSC